MTQDKEGGCISCCPSRLDEIISVCYSSLPRRAPAPLVSSRPDGASSSRLRGSTDCHLFGVQRESPASSCLRADGSTLQLPSSIQHLPACWPNCQCSMFAEISWPSKTSNDSQPLRQSLARHFPPAHTWLLRCHHLAAGTNLSVFVVCCLFILLRYCWHWL